MTDCDRRDPFVIMPEIIMRDKQIWLMPNKLGQVEESRKKVV